MSDTASIETLLITLVLLFLPGITASLRGSLHKWGNLGTEHRNIRISYSNLPNSGVALAYGNTNTRHNMVRSTGLGFRL
jgi:hypothetical protein